MVRNNFLQAGTNLLQKLEKLVSQPAWKEVDQNQLSGDEAPEEYGYSSGDSIQGYVAKSIDEARKLKNEGKKAILLINTYRAEITPYLKELSGIVVI